MKSLLVSVFFPAWVWVREGGHRFVNFTNSESLALRDARRMRDIVVSDWYQDRWDVDLAVDQRGVASFANTDRGFREAIGFSANITGRRGNTLIIDDPHDAKKAFSDVEIQSAIQTYDQSISSRLNDLRRDGIVLIMQRLRTNDLTGHLLAKKKQSWVLVRIPMEYEGGPGYDPERDLGTVEYCGRDIRDPRGKRGELMFPERFPLEEVDSIKEDLGDYGIAGQLQQRPSPLSGGILKKPWWRVWGQIPWTKGRRPPYVKHVFCSIDTAFSERDLTNNAYTAVTAWGIFWDEDRQKDALLMLTAWYGRVDYPVLRQKAQDLVKDLGMQDGDAYLVENKASGISLIQDLRKMKFNANINIRGYNPTPDGDKVARAYMAQALLKGGSVWIPDIEWAHNTVDIVAEFPAGGPPCADLTDTITQAIIYLKRRHYVTSPDDEDDEQEQPAKAIGYDIWPDTETPKRVGVYG